MAAFEHKGKSPLSTRCGRLARTYRIPWSFEIAPVHFSMAMLSSPSLGAPPSQKSAPSAARTAQPADALWGKTRVGMSQAAVVQLYPASQVADPERVFLQQTMLGSPSGVIFRFKADRLVTVQMVVRGGAHETANEISKTHGPPSACGPMPGGAIYICRWREGTLTIEASTIMSDGVKTIVEYGRTAADSASF
jgi:hypothetical protein